LLEPPLLLLLLLVVVVVVGWPILVAGAVAVAVGGLHICMVKSRPVNILSTQGNGNGNGNGNGLYQWARRSGRSERLFGQMEPAL